MKKLLKGLSKIFRFFFPKNFREELTLGMGRGIVKGERIRKKQEDRKKKKKEKSKK